MTTTFERMGQRLRNGVSSDGRPSLSYMLKYLFKSNSVSELSVIDVQAALGLRPGAGFADDPNATLQEIDIDRRMTIPPHCAWDVLVNYATNARVPENDSQDPTEMRVKMSKRFGEYSKTIIKGRDGVLIINAAGEPFKGGVAVPTFPYSFVYEWNRKTPTIGFHETINQNTFNGVEPGNLICLISSELVYEGGYGSYWKETIEMRHNPDGWNPSPMNAGTKERIAGLTKLRDCTDGHGQKYDEPQPLYDEESEDEDPLHIEGTMVPESDRPAGVKFLEVDHFVESNFVNIGVREFPE